MRTMRIISQNGEINLPYEMTALIVSENYIQAEFAGGSKKSSYLIASYSTKENCEKVLKMLNNAYTGAFYGLNIDILSESVEELEKIAATKGFGIIKVYQGNQEVKFEPANIIFRFPEDYEV